MVSTSAMSIIAAVIVATCGPEITMHGAVTAAVVGLASQSVGFAQLKRITKGRNFSRTRMDWTLRKQMLSKNGRFRRTYRVNEQLFDDILEKIRPDLECADPSQACSSSGSAVEPEIKLSLTLRFLAGGSYLDIVDQHGIGYSSFYKYVWQTCEAINKHYAMEFPFDDADKLKQMELSFAKKTGGVVRGCCLAIDGWIPEIHKPWDVPNPMAYMNRKGYFGVNMQGGCDGDGRFWFGSVKATGGTHDSAAFGISKFYAALKEGRLPSGLWIAGDDAYSCDEIILTPYPGRNLTRRQDSFNFHQSSLRIKIECAFGMLTQRWGIFWRPLRLPLDRVALVIMVCMKLHNLCIDYNVPVEVCATDLGGVVPLTHLNHIPDPGRRRDLERSSRRAHIADVLQANGLYRPARSTNGLNARRNN